MANDNPGNVEIILGPPESLYYDANPPCNEERTFEITGVCSGIMSSDVESRRITIGRHTWVEFDTPEETYSHLHNDEKAQILLLGELATIRETEIAWQDIARRRRERAAARQSRTDIVE